jgi:hypothetical protein
MNWQDVSNNKRNDFDSYINLLMQLEASKQAKYDAGLQSKVEQLMNMKEFDPSAKQGPIDAYLWDKFGIATKDTKAIQINEALDKIDLHRYGTDYSDIFDFSQPKRGNVARALFGEYDPNNKPEEFSERVVKNIQGAGNKNERSMAGFEPMGKNVTDTIAANRTKLRATVPKVEVSETNKNSTQKGGEGKAKYKVNNATANENFIRALQAKSDVFDTEWLKRVQAQNAMNMSGSK